MEKKISVDFLKNHPHFVPVIGRWIFDMWGYMMDPTDTVETVSSRVGQRLNDKTLPISMIALDDGEPVGTASLVLHDMKTRLDLTPWLAGVYVDEKSRENGVGSMLVQRIEELAGELGIDKLYLFTPDKCSFYGRMGWSFFEETEYRGENKTIMTKDFAP